MNFTSPFTRPPRSLANLIAGGEAYAQQRMKRYGHLNPAFLLLAEDGTPGAMFYKTPAKGGKSAGNSATCLRASFRPPPCAPPPKCFLNSTASSTAASSSNDRRGNM